MHQSCNYSEPHPSSCGAQLMLVPMDKAATAAGGKTILELEFNRIGSGTFPAYEGPAVLIKNYYTKITHYEPTTRIAYVCDEKDNYRLGFNGMEKDNEAKGIGNSLDFGARIYDSRLGRWLSLDPLQQKYPDLSPYNFTGDNPIMFIDPDGKKIVVYDKGKAYQYIPGVKPAPGSPQVLFKVHEAATYAMQTKTGAKIWNTVGSSERIVNINFKDATRSDQNTNVFRPFNVGGRKDSDTKLGDIDWDYNSRVIVSGGWQSIEGKQFQSGYISPSTVLTHELGHVFLMNKALNKGVGSKEWNDYKVNTNTELGFDADYDTKDERMNTETIERPYINEINEIEGEDGSYQRPRYNHQGQIDYDNNDADVNKNPSKSEQQREFNSPY